MSRQATKSDLESIAAELGISFSGKPSAAQLRKWIFTELLKLHDALAVLDYGGPGKGTASNQKRLQALYAGAQARRAQLRQEFLRQERLHLGDKS